MIKPREKIHGILTKPRGINNIFVTKSRSWFIPQSPHRPARNARLCRFACKELPQHLQVQSIIIVFLFHPIVLSLIEKADSAAAGLSAVVVDFVFDCHDSAIQASLMTLAAPIVIPLYNIYNPSNNSSNCSLNHSGGLSMTLCVWFLLMCRATMWP